MIFSSSAALARILLTSFETGGPPVIAEMQIGAEICLLKKFNERSISSKSISGIA